jgi:hypothetical protein
MKKFRRRRVASSYSMVSDQIPCMDHLFRTIISGSGGWSCPLRPLVVRQYMHADISSGQLTVRALMRLKLNRGALTLLSTLIFLD